MCAGWALGEFDFIFQACCDEPFATCSGWCADNGFGECAYVLVSDGACANELPYPYCDVDPWAEMPTENLSVRCVCMP